MFKQYINSLIRYISIREKWDERFFKAGRFAPIVITTFVVFCIRIRTRGGIYGKIWPEPKGYVSLASRRQSLYGG